MLSYCTCFPRCFTSVLDIDFGLTCNSAFCNKPGVCFLFFILVKQKRNSEGSKWKKTYSCSLSSILCNICDYSVSTFFGLSFHQSTFNFDALKVATWYVAYLVLLEKLFDSSFLRASKFYQKF